MLWVIREVKQRPVVYGFSFFIVLTAYFAGGMTALKMGSESREVIVKYIFAGEGIMEMIVSAAIKRTVLIAVQVLFCLRMASVPISVIGGMTLQISLSLPWMCAIKSILQGIFVSLLLLPISLIYMISGSFSMAEVIRHFMRMAGEMRIRKSAEDILRGGMIPAKCILAAGSMMLASIPAEVFFIMNII